MRFDAPSSMDRSRCRRLENTEILVGRSSSKKDGRVETRAEDDSVRHELGEGRKSEVIRFDICGRKKSCDQQSRFRRIEGDSLRTAEREPGKEKGKHRESAPRREEGRKTERVEHSQNIGNLSKGPLPIVQPQHIGRSKRLPQAKSERVGRRIRRSCEQDGSIRLTAEDLKNGFDDRLGLPCSEGT